MVEVRRKQLCNRGFSDWRAVPRKAYGDIHRVIRWMLHRVMESELYSMEIGSSAQLVQVKQDATIKHCPISPCLARIP